MFKIKLDIFENDQITDTVENVTNTDPDHLVISLEAFRQTVNDKLTQKVNGNDGNVEDCDIEEVLSSSEDEAAEVNCGTPKRRKK